MSTHEPPSMHDEPERDAWLSEALRHAPDASASPPAALSDAILREARAATRSPEARHPADKRPVNKWLSAWTWLARPPVAAGFASVMVATLAGLMWWGEPIDQTLQRPPAETSAKAEDPASTPAVTAKVDAPAAPPAATAAPDPAQKPLDEAARDATPRSAPAQAQGPRSSPKLAEAQRNSAAAPEDREKKAMSEKRVPAADSPDRQAEIAAGSPAAAPSPFPAPAAPVPPAAAEGSFAAKEGTPAGRVRQLARNAASTRAASVDALLASIAEQPERWTWQRSAGSLPVTESLQRWLQELRGTSGVGVKWQEGTQAPPATKPLRLYRDGMLAATLVVDEEGVWVMPGAGPASRAVLPPESATALRRSLDIAAP